MTTTNASYKAYIKTVRESAPPSETPGKVKSMVNYYKKDAFVEKPVKKSHDPSHAKDQCVRMSQSLNFWREREFKAFIYRLLGL